MKKRVWTDSHTQELLRLHKLDRYFLSEIAKEMGVTEGMLRHHARRLGLKQGPNVQKKFGTWNEKHKHLREPVMKYFLNHSFEDTCKQFNLTIAEVKSIMNVVYGDPKLKHLRKDKRKKSSWGKDELLFLVQHSGLMPRSWIARKLKRGTLQSTKECLSRLKTGSKHLNGLSNNLANLIVPISGMKTKAGAPGPNQNCHIRIVPWVSLQDAIKGKKVSSDIRLTIKAMARFQRWVHNAKTNEEVIQKIERILQR